TAPGPLLQAALDRARTDGVGRCDLIEVPPWSALLGIVPTGWSIEWSDGAPCPVLTLPPTVAGLADRLPASTLRKLRMNRNRADRAGGVRIIEADTATVQPMLDSLIRLHQARWAADDQPGVLADPRIVAFHGGAAEMLVRAGLLRLQALQVGGVTAAACHTLLAGTDRILFYLSGYDPAHAAISPGSLLLASLVEQAINEGRREADFLRGREAYKYAWGGVDRLNRNARLVPA
ncbi:MAG: GNAT family N-acetyltransferase, partial [Gemmatimonadaceae bacterium]|nr:GNAT family N-acetyltransferase [Acetobacteraceae bacterium]